MTEKKVDEEWKKQAVAEKEELAKKPDTPQKEDPTDEPDTPENFHEAQFATFLSGLATQVLMGLGEVDNPVTGEKEKNLAQAKYTIDLLQLLKQKTEGNLSEDENKYFDSLLYDVRMRYVAACE